MQSILFFFLLLLFCSCDTQHGARERARSLHICINSYHTAHLEHTHTPPSTSTPPPTNARAHAFKGKYPQREPAPVCTSRMPLGLIQRGEKNRWRKISNGRKTNKRNLPVQPNGQRAHFTSVAARHRPAQQILKDAQTETHSTWPERVRPRAKGHQCCIRRHLCLCKDQLFKKHGSEIKSGIFFALSGSGKHISPSLCSPPPQPPVLSTWADTRWMTMLHPNSLHLRGKSS